MKIALTGIKPTGTPHLGNYLGMIRPALNLARDYEAYYFIADYHAMTTVKDGAELRALSYDVAAVWLALGLDPARVTLYRQSDIPEVTELTWILACITPKGLMNRAHAYKASVDENRERDRDPDAGVNMGLFNYPILMAADILLPAANVVPVGADQRQHLEMTQDMAEAFNATYGPILTVPEAIIPDDVATIVGLDGRKMMMRIVTDSRPPDEPKNPEEDTIYQLYRHVAPPEAASSMAERYLAGGLGYGTAKGELYEALESTFGPARERYQEIVGDRAEIDRILAGGADRVRARAVPLLEKIRDAVGVCPLPAR